jgi:hypothetical protein
MAIDESTTIKNPGAIRTKTIIGLGKYALYKRILTGSPVTKSPLDLFTQCCVFRPLVIRSSILLSVSGLDMLLTRTN